MEETSSAENFTLSDLACSPLEMVWFLYSLVNVKLDVVSQKTYGVDHIVVSCVVRLSSYTGGS